jgi:hypothetical protein
MTSTGSGPQVTASGAQQTQQTHAGGTLSGGTLAGGTMPGTRPTGPTGTRTGSDDATVMERNLTASPKTIGSNDATVMERLDAPGAAPTAVEAKMNFNAGAQAEATVLERQYAPTPANRKPLMAAAAAIVVILLVAGYFLTRKPAEPPVAAVPTATAGTEVTSTGSTAPIAPGQGVLLLSASPWGDIERIVGKGDQREVPLAEENRSTPARIPLAPGDYTVTLSGESGTQTIDVRIDAGKPTQRNVRMRDVNFDELTQEVTKP